MAIARIFGGVRWALVGLILLVAFVASACLSWGELLYVTVGQTTDAELTTAVEVTKTGRRGGAVVSQNVVLSYKFTEPDGTPRTGTDTVPADWTPPESGIISVQYTPGAGGNSRLAGQTNWLPVGLFAFLLVVAVAFGFFVARAARTAGRDATDRPVI